MMSVAKTKLVWMLSRYRHRIIWLT